MTEETPQLPPEEGGASAEQASTNTQETTEELGGTAVAVAVESKPTEDGGHVVTRDDFLHRMAAEPVERERHEDINEYADSDRIEDVEQAHAMALAGDEKRSEARSYRKEADRLEIQQDAVREYLKRGVATKQDLEDVYGTRLDIRNLDSQARYADSTAEAIEEWAGILHEHPVSEAYKEAHSGIDFEPRALKDLDRARFEREREAELYEFIAYKLETGANKSTFDEYNGERRMPSYEEERAHTVEGILFSRRLGYNAAYTDSNLQLEWHDLETNPDTTIAQLCDFHAKLLREYVVPRAQNQANVIKSLLEDVRSGRASESPEPSAPE